jgi:hypothetical protein
MNGKLARIQEQERILAEQLTKEFNKPNDKQFDREYNDYNALEHQKEKKRKKGDGNSNEALIIEQNNTDEQKIKKKNKKSKFKCE